MDKRLYDLAYEFKRSKIWNYVYEEEFFAIRLGKENGVDFGVRNHETLKFR